MAAEDAEQQLASPIEVGDLIPDRALSPGDRDEFDYEPIADRIADLCCVVEPPVNIALFSPWGSGKSSLFSLIDRRLMERQERVKLIRYDAWRYGGEALPRNFIAHAARELHLPLDDPRYSEFHRGLYENQRRVSLSGPRLWRALRKARLAPLILLALAVALLGFLLDVDSVLIGAVISTFLLFITALIDAGKVEVEQSKPSEDEEFSLRFSRLIDLATESHTTPLGARQRLGRWWLRSRRALGEHLGLYRLRLWWSEYIAAERLRQPPVERLVFFIDELDRCERTDIIKTLKALRTFLDADRCAFIVAADRQVIEEALSEVEQSTPIDPESPYYSTAGAYIDKIFQHQIALPPLHGRSLASFARRLTISSGGVWEELIEADGAPEGITPTLDLVLFTLIPSHVRSPRRIKVLLNNYATNVRMVRSRLPEVWTERAREIARLTTFQTEFPDFAADLAFEPRLPRFLIDPKDAPESEQVGRLIERWDLDPGGVVAEFEDPDPLLADDQDVEESGEVAKERLKEAKERRRAELRRYLERTSDVADLRRDLFYLRVAGADVGLEDPELAELIEAEATDSPRAVIDALEGRKTAELAGAARLLASMVGDVLGPEQSKVMTALMGTAAILGEDASEVAAEIAGALNTYWSGNGELQPEHLVGALRTALTVRASDPDRVRKVTPESDLVAKVITDKRLWEESGRVAEVIPMAPELEDDELVRLRDAIAEQMPAAPEALLDGISRLEGALQMRVMDDEGLFVGIGHALDQAGESENEGEEE